MFLVAKVVVLIAMVVFPYSVNYILPHMLSRVLPKSKHISRYGLGIVTILMTIGIAMARKCVDMIMFAVRVTSCFLLLTVD